MYHGKGQECLNYTDGLKVKISERYKPPPVINLAMTSSQRLILNQQIRDNLPRYDFNLESNVKCKMKEWRDARALIAEERRSR